MSVKGVMLAVAFVLVGSLSFNEAKASTISNCEFVAAYIDSIKPSLEKPVVVNETELTSSVSYCVVKYDTRDLYGNVYPVFLALEYNHVDSKFVIKS